MFTRRKSQRENSKKKSLDSPCIESVDDRKRRKSNGVNTCIVCPVCTVTIRGDQKFHQHYIQEIDKVKEPFSSVDAKRRHYQTRLQNRKQYLDSAVEDCDSDEREDTTKPLEERTKELDTIRKKRYERYANMFLISMKRNNINRNTSSNNNNNQMANSSTSIGNINNSSHYELVTCAVCNEFLEANNCNKHLSKCFAKHDYQFELFSGSEEDLDDDEDTGEQADWMDNAHFRREGNLTRLVMEDDTDDVELDIDGDDENVEFGRQQFSETDIIVPSSESKSDAELQTEVALRFAVDSSSNISDKCQTVNNPTTIIDETEYSSLENHNVKKQVKSLIEQSDNDSKKLAELFTKHIHRVEERLEKDILKCPICMGPYMNPLVSVSCWHTCCSECWMRVLGSKKLCPKCNNIVAPSQLRKIYL